MNSESLKGVHLKVQSNLSSFPQPLPFSFISEGNQYKGQTTVEEETQNTKLW